MRRNYDYVTDRSADPPEFTTIWVHPDVATVEELLEHEGPLEQPCPNPDCGEPHEIGVDTEDDIPDMIDQIKRRDSTLRCSDCNEPLYGIRGEADPVFPED